MLAAQILARRMATPAYATATNGLLLASPHSNIASTPRRRTRTYPDFETLLAVCSHEARVLRTDSPAVTACTICQDAEPLDVRLPCCRQSVGRVCLDKWLNEEEQCHCPFCRHQLLQLRSPTERLVRTRVSQLIALMPADEWREWESRLSPFDHWVLRYRGRASDRRFNEQLMEAPHDIGQLLIYTSPPTGDYATGLRRIWEAAEFGGVEAPVDRRWGVVSRALKHVSAIFQLLFADYERRPPPATLCHGCWFHARRARCPRNCVHRSIGY